MNSEYESHTFADGTRIEWIKDSVSDTILTELSVRPSLEKFTDAVGKDFVTKHLVVFPSIDITNTLKERGSRYGVFAEHAYIAQSIQNVMRAAPGWTRLSCDEAQALTVIADKIARILNGDPHYTDNWHDIQGYAKLVEDRLNSGEPATQ